MKIIAFGHRKRTGKNTCATFLENIIRTNSRGLNVQIAGFADKLKQFSYQLYGHLGLMNGNFYEECSHLKEQVIPNIEKSPRQIWIEVGNKLREVYSNTWIDFTLNTKCDVLIIPDLRFPNECDSVREKGGYLVKVIRDSVPHSNDAADTPLENYAGWNNIIYNNNDKKQLYESVKDVWRVFNGLV